MCIEIIWNNSLVGRRTWAEVWTPATEHITLYCTWRPSVLTTRPHGQVPLYDKSNSSGWIGRYHVNWKRDIFILGWLHDTVVERWSVTGELSLSYARPWWVTTYVGKPSATGQPTRPTQPFILLRSINWVLSCNWMSLPHTRGALTGEVLVWLIGAVVRMLAAALRSSTIGSCLSTSTSFDCKVRLVPCK